MATFQMQDFTGAATTQAGLSEERSNRLIVTGLPATSATSAKETLEKHLIHILEISGVPPSRQPKYTISLAQASLGNIDGHPVNANSCAVDGPYEKGAERDPTKTIEDQSLLDLTLVSAYLNKFQPITIDGTVFNLGAHFAASKKDDLTRTISCSFVSTGRNADNKWADLAKVPVSELEKAAGEHLAELGVEVSYIFVYSMTRTNTAPRVLRVVLKHAHSGDIDKICRSSFSQVCLATTNPVMNEEITVVGSFNRPRHVAPPGPFTLCVTDVLEMVTTGMLGQNLASYIDTQRQRHNQNAPAMQLVNGYIIGVIKCQGTSAWEKTYFMVICSSFEYASLTVDVVSKVPAVGGGANLGDSTAMLSLSFVYDAQHTVWKPRRVNEPNDSNNQPQLTTLTNRMNGVDGALTTMLGALQTSMAAMQNLGTQLTQGANDVRRAMLEGT